MRSEVSCGNLTLNTNTLTFSNLYDSDTARSFGIGLAGSARSGGSSGGGIKGSASLTLDYLMHDYKQTTNAVVGSGNINTGATLNLDSNNDLTSVIGGTTNDNILLAGLNRDVTQSQIITKSLTVDPIHIKETFEFGRNSTESQQSASSNGGSGSSSSSSSSERPTIWQDLAKDRSGQSATQATGSFLSDVGSGLFSNLTITLSNLATQINPLRGFANYFNRY